MRTAIATFVFAVVALAARGALQEAPVVVFERVTVIPMDRERSIADRTVADILPKEPKTQLPVVQADATAIEIAALMARMRSPIVAVVEDATPTSSMIGAVSVAHLLELLLPQS